MKCDVLIAGAGPVGLAVRNRKDLDADSSRKPSQEFCGVRRRPVWLAPFPSYKDIGRGRPEQSGRAFLRVHRSPAVAGRRPLTGEDGRIKLVCERKGAFLMLLASKEAAQRLPLAGRCARFSKTSFNT
jgi:hypothetical protein